MQNRVVWVLQMGSRDWLWELARGWAEEIARFQQLQDGCQAWNWNKCNFKARKRKDFGAVKLGSYSSRQMLDNLQGSEKKSDSRNLCQAFPKKT